MSYTSPIFHLRGDSLNAYVSQSGKTPQQLLTDSGTPAIVIATDNGTGVFGTSVIQKASTTKVRALIFPGFNNFSSVPAFSLLMRIVPRFSGAPGFVNPLFFAEMMSVSGGSCGISASIETTGKLFVSYQDKYNTNYMNGDTNTGYTGFVSGTAVDLLIVWDGTTSNLTYYVNGTAVGTLTPNSGSPVINNQLLTTLAVGMDRAGVVANYDINEMAIWSSALSGSDITALSSRSTWIASTQFDGQQYSDPGTNKVLQGTSYFFAGVQETGTVQLLTNTMTQLQLKQNPSPGQALVMTQGDAFTFDFLALDDTNSNFDLTGASFSTKMLNTDGTYLTIPNNQHTANPDQVGHKGQFTMFISGTSNLKPGTTRTIITTVTVNSDVLQFRGTIQVLPSTIS